MSNSKMMRVAPGKAVFGRGPLARASASLPSTPVTLGNGNYASVGAPPISVQAGTPGARGEVRAYANRVDGQVNRMNLAFTNWLHAKTLIWNSKTKPVAPTANEQAFVAQWPPWQIRWKQWVEKISTFDLLGPSPTEAWQTTEVFETDLETFRKKFISLVAGTGVKVPDAPPLQSDGKPGFEEPGGVKPKIDLGLPSVPWTGILVVGGLIAAAFFLKAAKDVLPTPSPAPGGTPWRLPPKGSGYGASAPPSGAMTVHDAEFVDEGDGGGMESPRRKHSISYESPTGKRHSLSYEGPRRFPA